MSQISCPHEMCVVNDDGTSRCLMCEATIEDGLIEDDDEETAFAEGRTGYAFHVSLESE